MEQDRQEIPVEDAAWSEPGRRWGRWVVVGGIALVVLGAAGVAGAAGRDFGGRFGMGPGGWGHGGMGFGEGRIGRVLDAVDATDEQEERIFAIIDATRAELRPMMREFRDTREAVAGLLGAGTIDRAAAEKLRAERIARIDEASRKMTAAILDAAEVLTPEQRARLLEQFRERGPGPRW